MIYFSPTQRHSGPPRRGVGEIYHRSVSGHRFAATLFSRGGNSPPNRETVLTAYSDSHALFLICRTLGPFDARKSEKALNRLCADICPSNPGRLSFIRAVLDLNTGVMDITASINFFAFKYFPGSMENILPPTQVFNPSASGYVDYRTLTHSQYLEGLAVHDSGNSSAIPLVTSRNIECGKGESIILSSGWLSRMLFFAQNDQGPLASLDPGYDLLGILGSSQTHNQAIDALKIAALTRLQQATKSGKTLITRGNCVASPAPEDRSLIIITMAAR